MTKRKSKVLHKNVSQASFEAALTAYAIAHAKSQNLTSKMDMQISKIRDKYSEDLNELTEEQEKNYEVVQVYCEEHPELFEKRKSMETAHGLVGFRTGTPKLKTLPGYTWAAVLKLMKGTLPKYIRSKEEPNKEALLADRNDPEVYKNFKEVGITVDNDERFFIELKKEEQES